MGSVRRLVYLVLPRLSQMSCLAQPIRLATRPSGLSPLLSFTPQTAWSTQPRLQLQLRTFTTSSARAITVKDPEEPEKKLSIYQRFKQTYKTHGKILIAVHLCTTVGWFTCFYALIRSGVDVIGILESMNVSENLLGRVRSSAWVDVALSYLLYKLMSPVRYAVTIAGTQMVVKQFRSTGRIPAMREEDRLRNLAREGQASMKKIAQERRENMSEQYKIRKANFSLKYRERKEKIRAAARRRLLRARAKRKARSKDSDK